MNLEELTDKQIFFELMKRCKIHLLKTSLFDGKYIVYNVSNYQYVCCDFAFDENGKFIEVSCQ